MKKLFVALLLLLLLLPLAAQADVYEEHYEIGSSQSFDSFVSYWVTFRTNHSYTSSDGSGHGRTRVLTHINDAAVNQALEDYDFTNSPEGVYKVTTRFYNDLGVSVRLLYDEIHVDKRYKVTAVHTGAPTGYGAVTPTELMVKPGDSVTFTVSPVPSHTCTASNDKGLTPAVSGDRYTFANVQTSFQFTAKYEANQFASVTFTQPAGAVISVNGSTASPVQVIAGIPYTVKINANLGYGLTGVTFNGANRPITSVKAQSFTATAQNGETHTLSVQTQALGVEIKESARVYYEGTESLNTLSRRIFDAVYVSSTPSMTGSDLNMSYSDNKALTLQVYEEASYSNPLAGFNALYDSMDYLPQRAVHRLRIMYNSGISASNECQLIFYNNRVQANPNPLVKPETNKAVAFDLKNGGDFKWTSDKQTSYVQPVAYYDENKNPISAPSQPGSYFVELQLTEREPAGLLYDTYACRSDLIPFTITPVNITAIEQVTGSKTYDGTPLQLSFTVKAEGGESWAFTQGVSADCPKTPDYFFKKPDDSQFTPGLPVNAGTWQVMVTLDDVSQTGEVTIQKAAPTTSLFTITLPQSPVYDGESKPVTVKIKPGITGMGHFVLLYELNDVPTASPLLPGEYTLYLIVHEGDNYTSATLYPEGFTLQRATPQAHHFTLTPAEAVYDGHPKTVTVAPANGLAGLGEITQVTFLLNGAPVAQPLAAGSYTVVVDVAAGSNFNAAQDLELGAFTIFPAVPQFTAPGETVTLSLLEGQSRELTVAVQGADSLQWYRQPKAPAALPEKLPGATGPRLPIGPASLADSGVSYYCVAQNDHGSAQSPLFVLDVKPLPPATGDEAPLSLWLMLLCSSAALIALRKKIRA